MHETHDAPRGLKTPPPGMRLAPLSLVARSQRCDRTVRGTSLGPSLALPVLAANDTLDNKAVSFLLSRAQKEKEEVERRRSTGEVVVRYVGQVFLLPGAVGLGGFIESATAQTDLANRGDFVFSASYLGHSAIGDDAMFSARQLPTSWWEAFDLADL